MSRRKTIKLKSDLKIEFVNHSSRPMPKKWIHQVLEQFQFQNKHITIVFLNPAAAKKINFQFRKKNYATDVLSFSGEGSHLGELVLCPQVLKKQAKDWGSSYRNELALMLIHGVLHLLGHDHEGTSAKAKKAAQKMFQLQEQIFDSLLKSYQS
jgi:probable rRNA maturation factor